jgi:chaperonin cofactor prefoldin
VDILSTVINAVVVAAVGFIVIRVGSGRHEDLKERFEDLKGQVERLENRLDKRIDRLDQRIDGVQVGVEALRSDLTSIALAVGARGRSPRAQTQ